MCTGLEIFTIASTAFSAVSQINQGRQEQKFRNYQADQAQADAQAEREVGMIKADKTRKAGRAQQSEARAALAASGVEVGAGTPLLIEGEIARSAEEDALQEMLYGSRKGTRLDTEAQGFRMAGENAAAAGRTKAIGSVLAGGKSLMSPGWRQALPKIYSQEPAPVDYRTIR